MQAAAAAGYSALLIEKSALASGTSSRSSKLIHGGLRYLESGQFSLVRESLRERAVHLQIAPDLVELKPFFIPVYGQTRRRPWQLKLGLWIYALLGGFDASTRFGSVPRREWSELDGLETRGLHAVIRYYDAQTDDAQLTRAVVESARALGGEIAMPARFLSATLEEDGVEVTLRGRRSANRAPRPRARQRGGPLGGPGRARRAAGHPRSRRRSRPGHAHRAAHASDAEGSTTSKARATGAPFSSCLGAAPRSSARPRRLTGENPTRCIRCPEEEEYLLGVARHYFPAAAGFTREDIRERFAGLRVLPAASQKAFDRSRESIFTADRDPHPRVLSIYGGKLTGWRAAAAHVLERIRPSLTARPRRAATDQLVLRRTR